MSLHDLVVLIWMMVSAIHPQAARTGQAATVVNAVAFVVAQDPLPANWGPDESAAVLVVMAWRESRFRMGAVGPAKCVNGDCGAYSAWQIEHRPDLAKDPIAAARYEYDLIRRGVATCPLHPLAPAVGGCFRFDGKPNIVSQSISDSRVLEAYRVLYQAETPKEPDE